MSAERARAAADIKRAALRLGLTEAQAFELVKAAYDAAEGYVWKLSDGPEGGARLFSVTEARQAAEHPNGKCAEDIAARREGRPSRWGMPEFHRG